MAEKLVKRPNLAQQIAAILRQEILADFSPGGRIPPIMDLAKRFDVSYQTIREGLRILTEEGLIDPRAGDGTYVSDPGARRDRHIGVLAETDISDPHTPFFFRYTPQQVVRILRQAGAPARLYAGHLKADEDSTPPSTCPEFLEAVERHRLGGVVAFAPACPSPQWLEPLRRHHVPVVGWDGPFDGTFTHDLEAVGGKGAEYLLHRDRRRIALMEYHRAFSRPVAAESFQLAMASSGVSVNARWLRHGIHPCMSGAGWEEFRALWVSGEEKPDALLICDDNLFPGAAMAILQLGIRVPQDLLVVTHSNKGSGMTFPFPVVKLEVDPQACARMMGAMLLQLMRKELVENTRVVLPCELVEPNMAAVAGDASIAVANVTPAPRPNRRRKDEILV